MLVPEEIILKPLLTEKEAKKTEKSGFKQYAFIVAENANKIQIKAAIEKKYGVEVASLRTAIEPGKVRRRVTKAGVIYGKTSRKKKAYVTLAQAKEINFFEES
ncbi:MAG: 50S ribosomal protein L23 [Bacteroidia bacterium]|nr:50S ribosomal protein L23 [Bacteroidia bacterium]MDW8333111.1 50S ribosomal protein L23 [Bacteroidia bacterium]